MGASGPSDMDGIAARVAESGAGAARMKLESRIRECSLGITASLSRLRANETESRSGFYSWPSSSSIMFGQRSSCSGSRSCASSKVSPRAVCSTRITTRIRIVLSPRSFGAAWLLLVINHFAVGSGTPAESQPLDRGRGCFLALDSRLHCASSRSPDLRQHMESGSWFLELSRPRIWIGGGAAYWRNRALPSTKCDLSSSQEGGHRLRSCFNYCPNRRHVCTARAVV